MKNNNDSHPAGDRRPSEIYLAASEPGLTREENLLLTTPLPYDLTPEQAEQVWDKYQEVIGQFLIRMGKESRMLDSFARAVLVRNLGGIRTRIALIPMLGRSALHVAQKHGLRELVYRLAGEYSLMELSAAAGYRTFCFPELVRGLLKTGKMEARSVRRMIDTFEFLNTMFQHPLRDSRVVEQLKRTNGLHRKYRVAGKENRAAEDLFKYIALNMFYIGPSMRPDLTPAERHAICGITVLVARRMGHTLAGSVADFDAFIRDYEASQMFDRDCPDELRQKAVRIAQASKTALDEIPTISPARIHGYVPYRVKEILEID